MSFWKAGAPSDLGVTRGGVHGGNVESCLMEMTGHVAEETGPVAKENLPAGIPVTGVAEAEER